MGDTAFGQQGVSGGRSQIVTIQYLRGLAAISVVLYHAGGIVAAEKYQGNQAINAFTRGLSSGVDLFFVISGFVLALAIYHGRQKSFLAFFSGRALRIYPMAILTTLIFMASSIMVMEYQPDVLRIATSLTLVPAPVIPLPVVLWTLKQELLFYLIISFSIFHRVIGGCLFAIWALVSLGMGLERTDEAWLAGWFFHVQNFEFLAGFIVYFVWRRFTFSPRIGALLFWGGLLAFMAVSLLGTAQVEDARLSVLFLTAVCTSLVLGAALLQMRTISWLAFLGTASYSIYLFHFFLLSLFNKIIIRMNFSAFVDFTLISLGAVLGGCLFYMVFERRFEILRKSLIR